MSRMGHPRRAPRAPGPLGDQALVAELADVPVARVADADDPGFRIADFAHGHGVDLIMMPTHGLGLFRSLLVGSATAKVLHDAQCPVWTAALRLLHVVGPITDWPSLDSERALQEQVRQTAHAKIVSLQASAGVHAPPRVAVGDIVATVAEHAQEEDADLILIGRGSLHAALGRLRTHAYGIIHRSPCPVLSV